MMLIRNTWASLYMNFFPGNIRLVRVRVCVCVYCPFCVVVWELCTHQCTVKKYPKCLATNLPTFITLVWCWVVTHSLRLLRLRRVLLRFHNVDTFWHYMSHLWKYGNSIISSSKCDTSCWTCYSLSIMLITASPLNDKLVTYKLLDETPFCTICYVTYFSLFVILELPRLIVLYLGYAWTTLFTS